MFVIFVSAVVALLLRCLGNRVAQGVGRSRVRGCQGQTSVQGIATSRLAQFDDDPWEPGHAPGRLHDFALQTARPQSSLPGPYCSADRREKTAGMCRRHPAGTSPEPTKPAPCGLPAGLYNGGLAVDNHTA